MVKFQSESDIILCIFLASTLGSFFILQTSMVILIAQKKLKNMNE